MAAYHYYARPLETSHAHPFLVFDCQGELHLPLTVFAKEAASRLAPSSLKKYLTGILPWFTWLETDPWQRLANHRWTDPPEVLQGVVREYLVSRLQCRVKPHHQGGEWVEVTEEAVNTVRILLAGLKLFYRIAQVHSYYSYSNPLRGSFAESVEAARDQLVRDGAGPARPRMPDISGVDVPRRTGRLTDSYFLLKDQWIPQVVTDTELPQKILTGGRALKAQGKAWGLREECLICLLFETGARVSELMTLTLGDWHNRGLQDTAWARNKGSRKRRAKFVRFSQQTLKLLTRYFNTERAVVDAHHFTLDDYRRLAERGEIDLNTVPLFLSKRGTPWTVDSFRTHYWKRACEAAKIDVDIHQARHWYVTQALAVIHEEARLGKTTVERGLEELIAYMHWRAGERTLKAYNHYFQPTHHALVQGSVFKKLRRTGREKSHQLASQAQGRNAHQLPARSARSGRPVPVSETALQQAGAALYEFLIGAGGYTDDLSFTD